MKQNGLIIPRILLLQEFMSEHGCKHLGPGGQHELVAVELPLVAHDGHIGEVRLPEGVAEIAGQGVTSIQEVVCVHAVTQVTGLLLDKHNPSWN